MDSRAWPTRIFAALLTLIVLAGFCDVAAACALMQDASGSCCCPVVDSNPCLDGPMTGEDMPADDSSTLTLKIPSLEPSSADPLWIWHANPAFSAQPHSTAPRADGTAPIHLLCCVFLH